MDPTIQQGMVDVPALSYADSLAVLLKPPAPALKQNGLDMLLVFAGTLDRSSFWAK